MKKLIAALLLALSFGAANAATTVILVTPGTGTTSPITMVVSGTTLYGVQGMCDTSGNCPVFTGGTIPVSAIITTIQGTVQTSTFVSNATPLGPALPASATPVTPSNLGVGSGSISPAQVTVGNSTQIVAPRTGVAGTGRIRVVIENTSTTSVWVGASGVTSLTGMLLPPIIGASIPIDTTAGVFGTAVTSATVSEIETF